jgi:adenylate cyclase
MPETQKLAAILAADIAGHSKLAGAEEERALARLRALRSNLFYPIIRLSRRRTLVKSGRFI